MIAEGESIPRANLSYDLSTLVSKKWKRGVMKSTNSSPQRWNLLPPEPDANRSLRRANIIVILFLAFFVLGVFVAAMATGLALSH